MEMQRWDDAITQLRIVTEDLFYQRQEDANINLALAWLGKGDGQKALQIMRAAVVAYPQSPRVRLTLGRVYFHLDRNELAIEEYLKAVELSKGYANAHYNLGLAYLKSRNVDEARKAFREVVRTAPDSDIGRQSREHLELLK
jgi:Tfp pilus assembly protein PilF